MSGEDNAPSDRHPRPAPDNWHALAVAHSPVMIMFTDRDGNILYVNRKFTEVTGYTLDDVRGQNPRLLKSGQTPPETYRDLWTTILAGREWEGEVINRKKNGEIYWEGMRINPIRDANGHISHFLAVKEDVSPYLHLQAALQTSQERFRIVSDLVSDYAFSVVVSGVESVQFEWWTGALQRITGYTPDELLHNWKTFFHPEDLPIARQHFEQATSGDSLRAEFRIITRGGETRWVENRLHSERISPDAARFICAGRDITREKLAMQATVESERRFRALFEASPDAIAIINPQGEFQLMNQQQAALLGFEGVVELLSAHTRLPDFVAPADRQQLADALTRLPNTRYGQERLSLQIVRRDGTLLPAEINLAAISIRQEAPAIMAITRDMTTYAAVQEALRTSREQYRIVTELVSDHAFALRTDPDGTLMFEWYTDGLEKLIGHTLEGPQALEQMLKRIHPDDLQTLENVQRICRQRDAHRHRIPSAGRQRQRNGHPAVYQTGQR
ncbi:MAG: hypothetical protein Kow0077_32330 [Anaerolineae bacterium]